MHSAAAVLITLSMLQVTIVGVVGALLVFAAVIAYCRHKKLLAWFAATAKQKRCWLKQTK